jgi:hypothetical protein
MISTTTFKIKEKLNSDEIELLNSQVFNIIGNVLPEKIYNIYGEKISLKYNLETKNNTFILSSGNEHSESFSFLNEKNIYEIKHFNESYSFILNSFLICLKSISPNKIEIYKSDQNWEEYVLFANQILKNTSYNFFDVEYIETEDDYLIHISKNKNETCYRNRNECSAEDFNENDFSEDLEENNYDSESVFPEFNDDLNRF